MSGLKKKGAKGGKGGKGGKVILPPHESCAAVSSGLCVLFELGLCEPAYTPRAATCCFCRGERKNSRQRKECAPCPCAACHAGTLACKRARSCRAMCALCCQPLTVYVIICVSRGRQCSARRAKQRARKKQRNLCGREVVLSTPMNTLARCVALS